MSFSFYWYYIKKEDLQKTLETIKEVYNINVKKWKYWFSSLKEIGIKLYNHSDFYIFQFYGFNSFTNFNLKNAKWIKDLNYHSSWEDSKKDEFNLKLLNNCNIETPFLIIELNKHISYFNFSPFWKKVENKVGKDYEYLLENWVFWIKLISLLDNSFLFEIWLLENKISFNNFYYKDLKEKLNKEFNPDNLNQTTSYLNDDFKIEIKINSFDKNFNKIKNINNYLNILSNSSEEDKEKLIDNLRNYWINKQKPTYLELNNTLKEDLKETEIFINKAINENNLKSNQINNLEKLTKLLKDPVEVEIIKSLIELINKIEFKEWKKEINEETIWLNILKRNWTK